MHAGTVLARRESKRRKKNASRRDTRRGAFLSPFGESLLLRAHYRQREHAANHGASPVVAETDRDKGLLSEGAVRAAIGSHGY